MWYIGQEIVGIENCGLVVKGRIYTIQSLRTCTCKCGGVEINVGLTDAHFDIISECEECGNQHDEGGNSIWNHESNFAPLDQDISELT